MDEILKYFPELTSHQIEQYRQLWELYHEWNAKINVISRKDIDNLYPHHVLHSLGIARIVRFRPETQILDMGTGGGFPGIPLAIMFPDVTFHLVDSIGKKVKVAQAVGQAIGLNNLRCTHSNVMDIKDKYDFVVSRAVMQMPDLVKLIRKNIHHKQRNSLPNGVICLKGGDLQQELLPFRKCSEVWDLAEHFEGDFFATKKVAYVSL